jgi:hypothetical protein
MGVELSRGTPGVCFYEERSDGVGSRVVDGRVRCAVVCQGLRPRADDENMQAQQQQRQMQSN